MRILLTGGGTGGHIIPCMALAKNLRARAVDIAYMGGKNSLEEKLAKDENIDFYGVTTVKFRRDNLLKNVKIPFLLAKGIREAKRIMRANNIDIVFAKGGYVSLPAAYAARSLKIPVICHESDASLGLANRLIARFAKRVLTTNDDIKYRDKCLNLGTPIRDKIFEGDPKNVIDNMRYDKGKKFLLIIGGSTGAKALNDFVFDNIDALTAQFNVLHITGRGNNHLKHKGYLGVEFASNIEDYLALADYVVSRSGANAIAELFALNKKAILVPLENKASRGDQVANADIAKRKNLALVIYEKDLNMQSLYDAISRCDTLDIQQYDRRTNDRIVDEILRVAKEYHR